MEKNNDHMTWDEMQEIAESIICEKQMDEDIADELLSFLNNYKSMKDVLGQLQKYLMVKAKENNSNGSRLMGDGAFTKAYNASKKVDIQMGKMNKDAAEFIGLMSAFLKSQEV